MKRSPASYSAHNLALAAGRESSGPAPRLGRAGEPRYPRIGVYHGAGASHSWLWFAEVFERQGLWDLRFVDESHIRHGDLAGLDALAISGGDTFGIAGGLGPMGAKRLAGFIQEGGVYLGSCAGAYLPLNSSKDPLNLFNWVGAKISNLAKDLPEVRGLNEKFCTIYGCSYVYHPVREAISLRPAGRPPFDLAGDFEAPLYGGPGLKLSNPEEALARYQGFTKKTRFLVDRDVAAETILGRVAAMRSKMGQGVLYLYGPHLEHPRFPTANRLVVDSLFWDLPEAAASGRHPGAGEELAGKPARQWLLELKRQASNLRIVALALEGNPARWIIGKKVYEPAKFRVYAEALWPRLRKLEKAGRLVIKPAARDLPRDMAGLAEGLRLLKKDLDQGADTLEAATRLFPALNRATAWFMETYFASILAAHRQREAAALAA